MLNVLQFRTIQFLLFAILSERLKAIGVGSALIHFFKSSLLYRPFVLDSLHLCLHSLDGLLQKPAVLFVKANVVQLHVFITHNLLSCESRFSASIDSEETTKCTVLLILHVNLYELKYIGQ